MTRRCSRNNPHRVPLMSRRDNLAALNRVPHVKARWESFGNEYRIAYRHLDREREEATSYHTDDFEDAMLTAIDIPQATLIEYIISIN